MLETLKQKLTQRNQQGFTIIEVVLVLAIAGLIFLVVFLAVPQLQRSQRDSQRRSDMGRFMTSLETYASNNNGNYPDENSADVNAFVASYLEADDSTFEDPLTGSSYNVTDFSKALNGTDIDTDNGDVGDMYYRRSAHCGDSEGEVVSTSNTRQIAVVVPLENGLAACQDNR